MSAPLLTLDFQQSRAGAPLWSVVLLIVGLGALTAAYLDYRTVVARQAGLELQLAATLRRSVHEPADGARSARMNDAAAGIARELGTPWTAMLADLEAAAAATKGEIAILSIEPDHDKHRVRIKAESRDLPLALAYVERLQTSRSLRYPMLDSHEVVADSHEHPVRFAMSAEWRELP